MQLLFSILTPGGDFRNLRFISNNFNIALDVLTLYVSKGNALLTAEIIENNGDSLRLPVAAFDGVPIETSVQDLEAEYQKILCFDASGKPR